MKKIIFPAIAFGCALAFFACDQVIVNPPIKLGGFLPTVDSYMINSTVGSSETFTQTRVDSIGAGVGTSSTTLTLIVGGNNIIMANGEKAVKILRTYADEHSQEQNDSIYIVADSNGIIIYSDTTCRQSQNVILPPLTEGVRFPVSINDYQVRDYVVIDSLAMNIATGIGTIPAMKLTTYQVTEGQPGIVDSIATDMYLVPDDLEVYEVKTEVQEAQALGTNTILSKRTTTTTITSKSW